MLTMMVKRMMKIKDIISGTLELPCFSVKIIVPKMAQKSGQGLDPTHQLRSDDAQTLPISCNASPGRYNLAKYKLSRSGRKLKRRTHEPLLNPIEKVRLLLYTKQSFFTGDGSLFPMISWKGSKLVLPKLSQKTLETRFKWKFLPKNFLPLLHLK